MREMIALCRMIGMEEGFTKTLSETDLPLEGEALREVCCAMCDLQAYQRQQAALKQDLGEDRHGFKQLKILLTAALTSRERYRERGIDEAVFIDTMRCFARFSEEYRQAHGTYGFDRGFWVGRQLSLTLFRLGELEYELCCAEGKNFLSVHIPSDAVLTDAGLDASFSAARAFFARFFPEYDDAAIVCRSWLLSPALQMLLKPDSRILSFQRRFEIDEVYEDDISYRVWVFKTTSADPADWPENTSLQRNIKRFVLAGGKIGEAKGTLKQ